MGKTIRVAKGKEILEIDAQDLPFAAKDGYLPTERIIVANPKTKESFEIEPSDYLNAINDGFSFSDIAKKKEPQYSSVSPTASKPSIPTFGAIKVSAMPAQQVLTEQPNVPAPEPVSKITPESIKQYGQQIKAEAEQKANAPAMPVKLPSELLKEQRSDMLAGESTVAPIALPKGVEAPQRKTFEMRAQQEEEKRRVAEQERQYSKAILQGAEVAKQNPAISPRDLGAQILKSADPDTYALWEQTDFENRNIARRAEELGIQALAASGDDNAAALAAQDIESIEERFPEQAAAVVRQKIAAKVYERQGKAGAFAGNRWTMEKMDEAALDLSPKDYEIYKKYIRPEEEALGAWGTRMPNWGLTKFAEGFLQPFESIGKMGQSIIGQRGEKERAEEILNAPLESTTLGESAPLNQRRLELNRKKTSGKITADEVYELDEINKTINARGAAQKFWDGTANVSGNVVAFATMARGLGTLMEAALGRAGLMAGESTGAAGIEGIAETALSFGIRKGVLDKVGLLASGYAASDDDARKQALQMFPDDKDKDKRTAYAETMKWANATSELIFNDAKVIDAFKRAVAPRIVSVATELSKGTIDRATAKATIKTILDEAAKMGGAAALNINQESVEELMPIVADAMATGILAPDKLDMNGKVQEAWDTYTTMLVNGALVGVIGGVADHRQSRVALPFLSKLGRSGFEDYTHSVQAEVGRQRAAGMITADEATEKLNLINQFKQANDIVDATPALAKMPQKARDKYVAMLVKKGQLQQKAEALSKVDAVAAKAAQEEVKQNDEIRQQIVNGEVVVTDDGGITTPEAAPVTQADETLVEQPKKRRLPKLVVEEEQQPAVVEEAAPAAAPSAEEKPFVLKLGSKFANTELADNSVDEIYKLGETNPMNPNQVVIDGVKVEAQRDGSNILLKEITAIEQGKGAGTTVLKKIQAIADKNDVNIVLSPTKIKNTTEQQLRDWYKKNGFEEYTQGRLIYRPKSMAEAKVEQPKAAAATVSEQQPETTKQSIQDKVLKAKNKEELTAAVADAVGIDPYSLSQVPSNIVSALNMKGGDEYGNYFERGKKMLWDEVVKPLVERSKESIKNEPKPTPTVTEPISKTTTEPAAKGEAGVTEEVQPSPVSVGQGDAKGAAAVQPKYRGVDFVDNNDGTGTVNGFPVKYVERKDSGKRVYAADIKDPTKVDKEAFRNVISTIKEMNRQEAESAGRPKEAERTFRYSDYNKNNRMSETVAQERFVEEMDNKLAAGVKYDAATMRDYEAIKNKIANRKKEEAKAERKQMQPKAGDQVVIPSKQTKGVITYVRREDGWYFKDSRGKFQKETAANQAKLDDQWRAAQGLQKEVVAYHGSPHSFQKFTTEKIGTGEGAQAFGWGLYFTDLESIAKTYAEKLSYADIAKKFREALPDDADFESVMDEIGKGTFSEYQENVLKELEKADWLGFDYPAQAITYAYKEAKNNDLFKKEEPELFKAISNNRNLYKVSLHKGKTPEQYTWLEWDKPIGDKIEQILDGLYEEKGIRPIDFKREFEFGGSKVSDFTGDMIYNLLEINYSFTPKEASLFLLRHGFDGIKYPAESVARGATSDTARGFNYVVFDENAVTIEEQIQFDKSRMPLEGGASVAVTEYVDKARNVLQALFPDAKFEVYESSREYRAATGDTEGRGSYNPKTKTVALNLQKMREDAVTKTPIHEVIHPIVKAAAATDADGINKMWQSLLDLGDVEGMNLVWQHVANYEPSQQAEEGITEFITRVVDGSIRLDQVPKSLADKVIDLINKIFKAIGIDVELGSAADLRRLSEAVKKAFETGDVSAVAKLIGAKPQAAAEQEMIFGDKDERKNIEQKAKADGTWMKAPNGKPTNLTEAQWVSVRTNNFKAWFGDWENDAATASKVVDENGEPMVVYHGSKYNFDEFKVAEGTKSKSKMQLLFGSHFASTTKDAEIYAGENGRLYEVFLSIKNPINLSKGYIDNTDPNFDAYINLVNALKLDKKFRNVFDYETFTKNGDYAGKSKDVQRVFITQNVLDQISPKAVKEALASAGFDGVLYTPYQPVGVNMAAEFSKSYIAFGATQIKSATANIGTYSPLDASILRDKGEGAIEKWVRQALAAYPDTTVEEAMEAIEEDAPKLVDTPEKKADVRKRIDAIINPQKPTQNAVQERKPTQVPVGEAPADSGKMGKGNAQKQKAAEEGGVAGDEEKGVKPPKPPKEKPETGEEGDKFGEKAIIGRIMASEKVPDEIKEKLKDNLRYRIRSQAEARDFANNIVDEFGVKDAVVLAETGRFHGDVNSAIFAVSLDRVYDQQQSEADVAKKQKLAEQWADIALRYQDAAESGGRFISFINDFYKKNPAGLVIKTEKEFQRRQDDYFKTREKTVKEAWLDIIETAEGKELLEEEVSKRAAKRKRVFTKKSNEAIDKFCDRLKIDTRQTGSYLIPPQLYNAAVEVLRVSLKAGNSIAVAIEDAIEYINKENKNAPWKVTEFRRDLTKGLTDLKLQRELTEDEKQRILEKWRKKLGGLMPDQKAALLNRAFQKLMEAGALEYDDFKQMYAEAVGLPTMTPQMREKLVKLAEAINAPDKIKEQLQENPSRKLIEDYHASIREAEKAATELNELIAKEKWWVDTLLTVMRLNLLGTVSLIGNVVYNVAAMPVRFGVNLTATGLDYMLAGVQSMSDRMFGTSLYKNRPLYNVFKVQGGFLRGFKYGSTKAVEQAITGLSNRDYFQKEVRQNLKPLESSKKAWQILKGERKASLNTALNAFIEANPLMGWSAEGVARALNLGDKPFRFAAEYAKAEQLADAKGLKGIAKEAFILAPDEESAEIIRKHGEEYTLQQQNKIAEAIDKMGRYLVDREGATDLDRKVTTAIMRTIGYGSQPFLRTPLNAAIELMNYAVPPFSIAQGVRAGLNGDSELAIKKFSQAIVGLSISYVATQLVMNGLLVPDSDDEESRRRREGVKFYGRPNQINISGLNRFLTGESTEPQDGDVWIDLRYYGFVGQMLTAKAAQYKKTPLSDIKGVGYFEDMLGFVPETIKTSLTQGVFGGTGALVNAISTGDGRYVDSWLQGMAGVYQSAFVPAWLQQLSLSNYEYMADIKGANIGETVINKVKQRTFLGGELPKRVNIWGEKVKTVPEGNSRFFWYFFGLNKSTIFDNDKFGYQLYKVFNETKDEKIFPPAVSRQLKKVDLTGDQYEQLSILVGKNRKALASSYLAGKNIEKMNHETLIKDLNELYEDGRELGITQFLAAFPNVQAEILKLGGSIDEGRRRSRSRSRKRD